MLFGTGTQLIDDLDGEHIRLERVGASESATANRLHYAVVKTG